MIAASCFRASAARCSSGEAARTASAAHFVRYPRKFTQTDSPSWPTTVAGPYQRAFSKGCFTPLLRLTRR
eukprot:8986593-Lingulodinium_polyedra.AAC.1